MKTTMIDNFILTKMALIIKLTTAANTGKRNLPYIGSENIKQYTLETVTVSCKVIYLPVPYNPASPFLSVYPLEIKTIPTKRLAQVFIAALVITIKNQKQFKCTVAEE